MIAPICQVYGWTPDYINRNIPLADLLVYHSAAVRIQRAKTSEENLLSSLKIAGGLKGCLGKSVTTGNGENDEPDIAGFRALCGGHIKRSVT
jgi:hypothetical protein